MNAPTSAAFVLLSASVLVSGCAEPSASHASSGNTPSVLTEYQGSWEGPAYQRAMNTNWYGRVGINGGTIAITWHRAHQNGDGLTVIPAHCTYVTNIQFVDATHIHGSEEVVQNTGVGCPLRSFFWLEATGADEMRIYEGPGPYVTIGVLRRSGSS